MNEKTVKALSEAADLPLGEERLSLIAPRFAGWLVVANELSRTLAAAEHQTVLPITGFRQGTQEGREE